MFEGIPPCLVNTVRSETPHRTTLIWQPLPCQRSRAPYLLDRTITRLAARLVFFVVPLITAWTSIAQTTSTVGQWSPVMTWPNMAVHAHVLPTGKVMWWPPFQYGYYPRLWDPATSTTTTPTTMATNIFCSGHSFLANGQLFV